MIIPVRCITCGKPIAHLWEEFNKEVEAGKNPKKVLDKLGLKRYCCRSLFLTHMDLIDYTVKFKK